MLRGGEKSLHFLQGKKRKGQDGRPRLDKKTSSPIPCLKDERKTRKEAPKILKILKGKKKGREWNFPDRLINR